MPDICQVIGSGRGRDEHLSSVVDSVAMVRGLGSSVGSTKGMQKLEQLVGESDVVHLHNVMNPVALEIVAQSGKGVITVQDHRVFCPSRGKVLPSGDACHSPMESDLCSGCFDNRDYGDKTLALTVRRLDAVRDMRVIVLSNYMGRELLQLNVESSVIPPGVVAAVQPSRTGDGYLIGGRVVSHKGHASAVEAWRLSGVSSPLRVAGDGPDLCSLTGVEALGWLSDPELTKVLRGVRALIFPSDWQEPFGILGAEALAQGTPVIATRAGGIEDWSEEGVVLIDRGDVTGMASAIRELEGDDHRCSLLGAQGHRWIKRHLNPADRWGEVLSLYGSAN